MLTALYPVLWHRHADGELAWHSHSPRDLQLVMIDVMCNYSSWQCGVAGLHVLWGAASLVTTRPTNPAGLTLVGRMPSEVSSGWEQRETSCCTTALPPAVAQLPERTAASMSTNSLSACRVGSGVTAGCARPVHARLQG